MLRLIFDCPTLSVSPSQRFIGSRPQPLDGISAPIVLTRGALDRDRWCLLSGSGSKGSGDWYREALGLDIAEQGFSAFPWDADPKTDGGATIWAPFAADTDYLAEGKQWMVDFRVDNLKGVRERRRAAGAELDPKVDEGELASFGWAVDPEGNTIELWQPPAAGPDGPGAP